jgi:hypothetical protein
MQKPGDIFSVSYARKGTPDTLGSDLGLDRLKPPYA